MNRLDGDDCGMMNLRTEVQCKLLVLLVRSLQQGTRILFTDYETRVQFSTIECTNISQARLKMLISGTDNNWL